MSHVAQADRRQNQHQQRLIDIGVLLQRCYGDAYARRYLGEVNIPAPTIDRILARLAVRPKMPCTLETQRPLLGG